MAKKKKQHVGLEFCELNLNGKLKYRVTAKVGDKPLHMHAFDIANDTSRSKFLGDLETKARNQGVDVDLPELEAGMLQFAQDAALGLAEDDGSAAGREVTSYSEVLTGFGLTVLCELDNQSIYLWSEHTHKHYTIDSSNWCAGASGTVLMAALTNKGLFRQGSFFAFCVQNASARTGRRSVPSSRAH